MVILVIADSDRMQDFLEQMDIDGDNADDVVRYLKYAIINGMHWYIALLNAVGKWNIAEEDYSGKHYQYIIGGDALDYFLVVKRLCHAVHKLIPEKERKDLLLLWKPPLELDNNRVRQLMGNAKYQAYLNYLYGVVVEDALTRYVEDEVRKEQHASVFIKRNNISEEACHRIYGVGRAELRKRFKIEMRGRIIEIHTLGEKKEFTYWRFKYRLKYCNKEKVASDTRKGLKKLNNDRLVQMNKSANSSVSSSEMPVIDIGMDWGA